MVSVPKDQDMLKDALSSEVGFIERKESLLLENSCPNTLKVRQHTG